MNGYDFERPFISQKTLQTYTEILATDANDYATFVRAGQLTNLEYCQIT